MNFLNKILFQYIFNTAISVREIGKQIKVMEILQIIEYISKNIVMLLLLCYVTLLFLLCCVFILMLLLLHCVITILLLYYVL